MTQRWDSDIAPVHPPVSIAGWLRIFLRISALFVLVFGGLLIKLLVRLVERPFCGVRRPVTPYLTQFVCRNALRLLGLRLHVQGTPMRGQGAIVANHTSWLDIFVLNASKRIYFVSKSEVASWPGIGWLARATGTVFIVRAPSRAREQTEVFQNRLLAGHKLLFFPEGTSTDGLQVLPFKTTLFQSFFAQNIKNQMAIQPVSVIYHAPEGLDRRFYGWWGDTSFGAHLLATLAPARQGWVDVIYHPPLRVADYPNRKALALACEADVRKGHLASLT
ncbi:lysophospholipid acyltransferase family protein [Sulfitobacter sp. F26204]|uniref:lysophospholipid acyltransferase family protein n=1 Tax=Sulfitobacter sp. F26204 TaxID=2996014 RepID=UPI00225E60DD|nr:lysophospholipid acyltransferase family protein [Sulfitobacter sp. F26204]MCX7559740.1 lysophospholipid acyltransferase family protein [Sulfitobacter sp. F26204]